MAEFLDTDATAVRPRFPRRWLQFGFATLLKVVAVAAVLSAWWADRERLTERIGRLENDQSVLRIAIADDAEDAPWYSDPYAAASAPWPYPPTTSAVPPAAYGPVATVGITPATATLADGGATPAANTGAIATASPAFRVHLYYLLNSNEKWLKANFSQDRGWQEFLARGAPQGAYAALADTATSEYPSQPPPPPPPPPNSPTTSPSQEDSAPEVAKQCLPAVVKLLVAGEVEARRHAVVVLADLGGLAVSAVTDLAEAANDADVGVRQTALKTLAALGPGAKAAAPRLSALMRADDARCRPVDVACALLHIDPQTDVVSPLVKSLRGKQADRAWTLDVLSSLDASRAAVALPVIAGLLDDEDPNVRLSAAKAYSRLADRHDATETLQTALKNERHKAVQRGMARLIVRLQNAAR